MSFCIYQAFYDRLLTSLRELFGDLDEEKLKRVELNPSRDPRHGDMATNAAMILAGVLKKPPRDIAPLIAQKMQQLPDVEKVDVAGAGFVNVTLSARSWHQVILDILRVREAYGDSDLGQGRRVNVEYISANPTGPLHVGHCRGAVVGDVLASLLKKTGFHVIREFYVNDAGTQIRALGWACYWRYIQYFDPEFSGETIAQKSPVGLQYGGDYLIEVGRALAQKKGAKYLGEGEGVEKILPEKMWLKEISQFAVAYLLDIICGDLRDLGVRQDQFIHESDILASGQTQKALALLKQKDCLYYGVLPPPKGKQLENWQSREQWLFRSTAFGDDRDRPLQKPDGTNTYFANDVGYHFDKIKRGADVMIDVWGADHGGYVKRMKAAVAALSDEKVPLQVLLCQIVHILRGGEVIRMSKRLGTFVTVRDLIDEVGRDAIRFTMLTRRSDAQMNFDLAEVVAQKHDNPIFYVQYAHARCCSVLRAAQEAKIYGDVSPSGLEDVSFESLKDPSQLALIKKLAQWPRTLQGAARHYEPHRLAFYLLEVAADFHALWNHGKEKTTLRFLQEKEIDVTRARLALIWACVLVLRSGFDVMGVTAIEEMR